MVISEPSFIRAVCNRLPPRTVEILLCLVGDVSDFSGVAEDKPFKKVKEPKSNESSRAGESAVEGRHALAAADSAHNDGDDSLEVRLLRMNYIEESPAR